MAFKVMLLAGIYIISNETWNKSEEKSKDKVYDWLKFFYEFGKLYFVVICWSTIGTWKNRDPQFLINIK